MHYLNFRLGAILIKIAIKRTLFLMVSIELEETPNSQYPLAMWLILKWIVLIRKAMNLFLYYDELFHAKV